MSNSRLIASQLLAVVALGLALLNDLGLTTDLGLKPEVTGISALLLAFVAFFVALRTGSVLVSACLTVQGIANVAAAAQAGATIGIPFGLVVLVLGIAKALITLGGMKAGRGAARAANRPGIGKAVVAAIVIIVVALAGVAFYEVSSNTGPPNASVCSASTTGGEAPVQVSIYSGAANSANPPGYTPDNITVVIGVNNTVTWTNNDSIHHTVTTTSAPAGGSFNSGNMQPGATCTHTFTVPGTYEYYCVYHRWMTGTVIVKASS
jgi:plastocyanin